MCFYPTDVWTHRLQHRTSTRMQNDTCGFTSVPWVSASDAKCSLVAPAARDAQHTNYPQRTILRGHQTRRVRLTPRTCKAMRNHDVHACTMSDPNRTPVRRYACVRMDTCYVYAYLYIANALCSVCLRPALGRSLCQPGSSIENSWALIYIVSIVCMLVFNICAALGKQTEISCSWLDLSNPKPGHPTDVQTLPLPPTVLGWTYTAFAEKLHATWLSRVRHPEITGITTICSRVAHELPQFLRRFVDSANLRNTYLLDILHGKMDQASCPDGYDIGPRSGRVM